MYIENDDTIYAPATIPGTGAISVIRISGSKALEYASTLVECHSGKLSEASGYTVMFGRIYDGGELLDEVLATVFRAPHSYTGEDSVEISCHASKYIADRIMFLLSGLGARVAYPGEFTKRAFLNGKMDLAQAEAVADLISSQSSTAHRVALSQLKGGFSKELKTMRDSLLNLVSLMELELDFSEEEVEFADRTKLSSLLTGILAHIDSLIRSFKYGNAIKNGIPVAIAGSTNTGKSTLLNTLLGEERAIVSDVHGTTRDTIEETLNVNGLLFRFIDTAGIRETDETVEQIGIVRTFRKISEAQVIVAVVDASRPAEDNVTSLTEILSKADPLNQKLIVVVNKTDLSNDITELVDALKSAVSQQVQLPDGKSSSAQEKNDFGWKNEIETVLISAKNNDGIDILKDRLAAMCKEYAAGSDATMVTNLRHFEALSQARTSLLRVQDGLASGVPTDLVSQDIREAIYHLGSIVGEISTDEVLGNIFRNFCIGK